jgi:hypothetical protein
MSQFYPNAALLLIVALMFIGTALSEAAGFGLLVGAAIVLTWNVIR